MHIPKASDEDKDHFRSLLPDDPDVTVKAMFGNLGAFVNGHMFAGLFGSDVGVRLADEDRGALEAIDGAGPFGPQGRPMGGYVGLPNVWATDPRRSAEWVARAHAYVSELPPKLPKASRGRRPAR